MLSLKHYALITAGHLIPIEMFFGCLNYYGIIPNFFIERLNYIYLIIVSIHGIFWGSKKLHRYVKLADFVLAHQSEIEYMFTLMSKPKSGVTNESDEDFMNRVGART